MYLRTNHRLTQSRRARPRAGALACESNSSGEGRPGVLAQGPPKKTKVAAKAKLHVSGTSSIRIETLASGQNGLLFPQT